MNSQKYLTALCQRKASASGWRRIEYPVTAASATQSQISRKFRFPGATWEVRGSLCVPAKRRRALVATNPIKE